jgi:hypothetical protein
MELEKVSPKSTTWNSWTDECAQQGLHREFFKYSKGMKLLVQMHLKIFSRLFSGCTVKSVLPNWKKMHAYVHVVKTCDDRDEFLGTTLVEMQALSSCEYFLCDNMPKFISSLKGMNTIEYQPIFVKKYITPTMDSKNREKDIAPTPFAFHITILSMKDEVNGFIILLEFLEETPMGILITDQYSEPSYVTRVKLEMLITVANESNTCELVTQLCEDTANVNIPIARESIWVVGKMTLPQYAYDVSTVVPLLHFHEMENSYATSNALMLATTIKSSAMVIPWDPGKFNTFMTKVTYQCCLRNSLSIYGLLNFVYDRGKVLAQKHLGANHVDLSVFNGSIFMCFSSKWMDHLAARRVIETFPNLEDKVVFKGVVLIETWIMRWTLFMGPNQSFGEFILEECRRMMRCQGWFMRCMTLSNVGARKIFMLSYL